MVFYVLMCLFLFLIQKTSLLSFFQLFSPSATLSCFVDRFLPVLYLTVCSCAEHSVYEIFKSRQVFAFPLQNHFPIFWEEKKKNPELPNKLNILILKLNCSFFFFFKNVLRKAAAANSRCWHLSWPWVFFTWKPAAHCSSGAQRMHSPLRVGVWCWGLLGWASGLWSLLPQPDSKGRDVGSLEFSSLGLDASSVSFCTRAHCPKSLCAVGEKE